MNKEAYKDLRLDMLELFIKQFHECERKDNSFYIPSLDVIVGYFNNSKVEHFSIDVIYHPKKLGIIICENISTLLNDCSVSNYNQHKEKEKEIFNFLETLLLNTKNYTKLKLEREGKLKSITEETF